MRRIMAMTLCFVLVISAIPFFPALAGTVEEEICCHSRERDVTDYPELMEEAWFDECYKPFTFAESSEIPDDIQGRADIIPMNLNDSLTRGRAAAYIVMRRENALTRNGNIPHMPFNDVPMHDWARNMIAWANNRRWINGVGNDQFAPARYISRQDFAVLIVRAFDNQTTREPLPFSDRALIAPWAIPYIERAVARGWITGFPDGTFRPGANISRNDGIVLTNRAGDFRNIGSTIFDPTVRQLTWNVNSGTAVSPTVWNRAHGHAIGPLPNTTRANHGFAGWFSGAYRITTNTVLNTNGTAFAIWRPNTMVTMNYNVRLAMPPGEASQRLAEAATWSLNEVTPIFMHEFNIRLARQSTGSIPSLNQRPNCTVPITQGCSSARGCGANADCLTRHHRSSGHFIHVNRGTMTRPHFKFVDYRLCWRDPVSGDHLDTVNGLALLASDTVLVSTRSDNIRRTTAHEISHLFGARDATDCNIGQSCVMRRGNLAHNHWCVNHRNQILAGRNR